MGGRSPGHETLPPIRLATVADAPRLAELREEFRTSLEPAVHAAAGFVERCTAWMAERLPRSEIWRCWVAETEVEGTVGMVWVQFLEKLPNPVGEPELHAYLTSFYIRPSARGRGLGTLLLEAALHACRDRGCDSVFLWSTPRSRSLYLRFGFTERAGMLERRMGVEASPAS